MSHYKTFSHANDSIHIFFQNIFLYSLMHSKVVLRLVPDLKKKKKIFFHQTLSGKLLLELQGKI